jgi:ABC-2 type transport system permease protein
MIATSSIPPLISHILITTIYGESTSSVALPISLDSPALVVAQSFSNFDYMAPGLFAFAPIFMTMTVAQALTVDRENGLLKRLSTTPMSSSEYMLGKTFSNLVLGLIQGVLIFTSTYVIGYRPATTPEGIGLAFLFVSLFILACVGFGLITAVLAKSAHVATGIAFIFIMPQMFFGTFMPLGGVTEVLSKFTPSYYVTHALTTLFLRGASITTMSLWLDLLVVVGVSIGVLVIGSVLFRRQMRYG